MSSLQTTLIASCTQGRVASGGKSLSLTERDANFWASLLSPPPKHGAQQHEQPVPSHAASPVVSLQRHGWAVTMNVQSRLSCVTRQKLGWEPLVKGGQVLMPCRRADACAMQEGMESCRCTTNVSS